MSANTRFQLRHCLYIYKHLDTRSMSVRQAREVTSNR